MKVKNFLERYVYSKLNQYWVRSNVSRDWEYWIIESWLARIFSTNEKDKKNFHSWQIKYEAFPYNGGVLRMQTKYPIIDVVWFHEWSMPVNLQFSEKCWCGGVVKNGTCVECKLTCWCTCDVWDARELIKYTKKTPWGELQSWQYQIAWGRNNWWYWWQIINAVPSKSWCKGLWVEYYAWYNPITCDDDDIALPYPLYAVLGYLVASDIIDIYWQGNETAWQTLYNKWLSLLYAINEDDWASTRFNYVETRQDPKQDTSMPYVRKNNGNLSWRTIQV